jgi:acyl-homoserine-lactone acylase
VTSDEGWNMVGGLFPGGMSVFVGSNPDLGWAHTTNYNTWGDIYKLQVKGSKYKYDGKWKTFTSRKIKLKLKLGGVILSAYRKITFL